MKSTTTLSKEDVARLMADRSIKTQIEVVEKLTDHYAVEGPEGLNEEQRALANDIFSLLLARAGIIVRAMLAMQLSQTNNLPHDLARKMAEDVDEVASPILQYSDVLTDQDLTEIIVSLVDPQKLRSIALRDNVSEKVSDVLVNTHLESVVNTLVKNEGAAINEKTFDRIAQEHGNNPEVMESIFKRDHIPVTVVEKVITHLSQTVKQQLEQKYGSLSEIKTMHANLDHSLELASIKMMGFESSDQDLMKLIAWLRDNGTLSPFSAISICDLQLLSISLSRLLRIPVSNVELLLRDEAGFRNLYDRAKLPPNLFDAMKLAVDAIQICEEDLFKRTGARRLVERDKVVAKMQELSKGKTIEGLDHIYAMMRHCTDVV